VLRSGTGRAAADGPEAFLIANSKQTWGVGAVAAAAVWAYAPVLLELGRDWWRDPNYSHGFLIPVVSGCLVWQRRRALAALPAQPSLVGLLGVLTAAGLLVLGTAGAEVFTQRVSFVLFLASAALYMKGWGWFRRLAFPIAFLLLAIPLPYVIYYGLTQPLQHLAARTAVAGLHAVGIPVVGEGNVIHLPDTSLEVAEACSGIRSLYAFLALGALFARALTVPGWVRWLVFAATVPLSVAGNAVRVWGTGVSAYLFGPQAAQGTPHELFGLLVFGGTLLILVVAGRGLRRIWDSGSSPSF